MSTPRPGPPRDAHQPSHQVSHQGVDQRWDGVGVVVPAGGAGRRLGGSDKPGLQVGGRSLLAGVLLGLPPGVPVAVVGPERAEVSGRPGALGCREDPPGGGPAAAVAAGLEALAGAGRPGRLVAVVPGDAPRAAEALPALLDALLAAPDGVTAAVAVDPGGHRQVLVAVHRARALRERVEHLGGAAALAGAPAGRLLPGPGRLVEVPVAADLLADVDTPADLAAARARAGSTPPA